MSQILVCTDGSAYAPSIYEHAAWAAERLEATVHFLHVIERDESHNPHDFSGSLGFDPGADLLKQLAELDESHARIARLRGKAILADAQKRLSLADAITTQRHGSLVETVTEFEGEASLIILGKRGEHTNLAKGHLGSNLERVVRSAKKPVLVAARQFTPVEHFTIAFDGGHSVLKAISFLAKNPLLKGAHCRLLAIGKEGSELQKDLFGAKLALEGAGFEVTADLFSGDPDEVIAKEVKSSGSDLIVMGAYGHSRVRQFILGSTTASLIRTCTVPVLLFR